MQEDLQIKITRPTDKVQTPTIRSVQIQIKPYYTVVGRPTEAECLYAIDTKKMSRRGEEKKTIFFGKRLTLKRITKVDFQCKLRKTRKPA